MEKEYISQTVCCDEAGHIWNVVNDDEMGEVHYCSKCGYWC